MLNEHCKVCMHEARIVQGRSVGSLYIKEKHITGLPPEREVMVKRWGVFVQGDGTLQGDTVCLAQTWDESLANDIKEWLLVRHPEYIREASKDMQIFRDRVRVCPYCQVKHEVGVG